MSNSIFPSGKDVFIDPGPNTPESGVQPHHLMHSIANDAIIAMETTLLQQFMAYSPVIVPDLSKGNVIIIGSLTGNILIDQPINAAPYSVPLVFVFTQDSTGGHSVSWDPSFVTTWGIDPTPNTSSSIGFVYQPSSATWIPVHAFPDQVSITSVSGNLDINGNLNVSGEGFFSGTLNTAGISDSMSITTTGTVTAAGLNITSGTTSLSGSLTIDGSISTTGPHGTLTTSGSLIVSSGGAEIFGNGVIQGALTVYQDVDVLQDLVVSGSTSIGAPLTVSSTVTCSAQLTCHSIALPNGEFEVDANGNMVGQTLEVVGVLDCGGALTATTSISTSGPISSTGNGTISTGGTISAGGTCQANYLYSSGNITAAGAITGTYYYSSPSSDLSLQSNNGNNGAIFLRDNTNNLLRLYWNSSGTNVWWDRGLAAITGSTVVYASNGQMGYNSSSNKVKLDIRDLEKSGSDNPIFQIRPVTFKYDPEKVAGAMDRDEAGIIVEELDEVAPDMVFYNADGEPVSPNTNAIIGYLIDAVIYLKKELNATQK